MSDAFAVLTRRFLRLPLDLLIFWIYLALLIFDFRRSIDDTGNLVVILGVGNVIVGAILVARARVISLTLLGWMVPFIIFLLMTPFVGILRGQSIYAALSSSIPLLMFIIAALVIGNTYSSIPEPQLTSSIALFSVTSVIWKFAFGFFYTGYGIENIRYQIISGALPLLFAYGLAGFLVKRERLTTTALVLSLLVLAVSVTRSYIFVFAASTFCAILVIPFREIRSTIVRLLFLMIVSLIVGSIFSVLASESFARWAVRLGSSNSIGFDLTGATRIAELNYQIKQLKQDALGLFLGFGQNAETHFSGPAAKLVESVLGAKGSDYSGHGYGHVFYAGLLYVGGMFFGLPVIVTFVLIFVKSGFVIRKTWFHSSLEDRFLAIWGFSSFTGYLAYGALGGTWGDRSMSFYFGISTALCLRYLFSMRASHLGDSVRDGRFQIR